jgi:hypothetical protein
VINAGKSVQKATHDTGRAVQTATHDAGRAIEVATHDAGHAVEKAVGDTGHAVEKATHDTGHYIEKHPLEAALAVALIGGGAYLVAFQDFNLVVQLGPKSLTLIQGGALNGALSAGAGAGGLAAGASTASPRSGSHGAGGSGSGGVVVQTTLQNPSAAPSGSEIAASNGTSPGVGLPGSLLAPGQARPLSDFDARIKFSRDTLERISKDRLLENFRAAEHPVISPVEVRILDAIRQLSEIENSPADMAAKAQERRRDRFGIDALKGTVGFPPVDLFTAMIRRLARLEVEPTLLGDGTAAARDHHLKLLREQLEKFRVRRALQESAEPRGPVKLPEPPPTGPTWRAS